MASQSTPITRTAQIIVNVWRENTTVCKRGQPCNSWHDARRCATASTRQREEDSRMRDRLPLDVSRRRVTRCEYPDLEGNGQERSGPRRCDWSNAVANRRRRSCRLLRSPGLSTSDARQPIRRSQKRSRQADRRRGILPAAAREESTSSFALMTFTSGKITCSGLSEAVQ